jgi:hypothetical protein
LVKGRKVLQKSLTIKETLDQRNTEVRVGDNQINPSWKVTRKTLRKYKEISLMMAMFFLPLGYDALFKFIMNITGSYWAADIIFYLISGSFFCIYFFLSKLLSNN